MKSPSPNKLMSLPANLSGWMDRIFGRLMKSTNVDAYQKTLQALNLIDGVEWNYILSGTGSETIVIMGGSLSTPEMHY
jgi:putative NADPH-quinone reductase